MLKFERLHPILMCLTNKNNSVVKEFLKFGVGMIIAVLSKNDVRVIQTSLMLYYYLKLDYISHLGAFLIYIISCGIY